MAEPRVPYFSARAIAASAPATDDWFGFSWQEVVTRVEAFCIHATDKILKIRNLPHDETRESLTEYIHVAAENLLILLPGEYVVKAEVWYTDTVVTALRIFTSKRVTPFYGACEGKSMAFEAEDGMCINAFCGDYGPEGCNELGVVFGPKEMALDGHSLVLKDFTTKEWTMDDGGDENADEEQDNDIAYCNYRTFDEAPRAVVVTMSGTSITSMRVVSAREYDRIVRYPESFSYAEDEVWFVLVDGERLQAVSLEVEDKRIKLVPFRTNYQTSHGIGLQNQGAIEWLSCDDVPDAYICGFDLEIATSEAKCDITKLALLCMQPQTDTRLHHPD